MNKLSKDVVVSIVFSFLNILFNFWLIKEAEYTLSVVHLGILMYIRRIAPTFSNILQLGTSQALVRFTSIEKDDIQKVKIYYTISTFVWVLVSVLLVILFWLFHDFLSLLFFPDSENSVAYLKITFIYISILHLSHFTLPYFLNLRKVITYNMIVLLIASLSILISFKFLGSSADVLTVLTYSLVILFTVLILTFMYVCFKIKLYILPSLYAIKKEGKRFIMYGLPRAFITFSDMFLLTVGAMLIQGEEEIVASFLIGIVLSRTILIVLQPISLLSAVISGHHNTEEAHKKVLNLIVGGTIYTTTITTILFYNWIDILLPFWLKNEDTIETVMYVFKILAIGIIPYTIFQSLKGIIDIKYFKPLNLYSLFIAVAGHIVFFYILNIWCNTLQSLSISLSISFIILGIFALYWNRKYLYSQSYFNLFYLLIFNLFVFVINFKIHDVYPSWIGFLISVTVSIILFLIFCLTIKSPFLKEALHVFNKRH
ncbi:Na+-driven multidrug efflux pump [Kordia periserrulae]|uniref:Na+-driven multidrug efflux pump n=1 Tax=Kordia periserrulae TaxID=701523 RepID=A0A2T6BWM3_9FLAO|nr:oligosaccharide flippase family protein [Kordia periserrulae]PTX60436.1 Na+-driven multidrug efflux pump [Kordia periserrulae]